MAYCWRSRRLSDATAIHPLQKSEKPDPTGQEDLESPLAVVPFFFWINQKSWYTVFMENGIKYFWSLSSSNGANLGIWARTSCLLRATCRMPAQISEIRNWICFIDHTSVVFFDHAGAPFRALTTEKRLWSILFQKKGLTISQKLLVVIDPTVSLFNSVPLNFGEWYIPYENVLQILTFWKHLSWGTSWHKICQVFQDFGLHDNRIELPRSTSGQITSTVSLYYMYIFLRCRNRSLETAQHASISEIWSLKVLQLNYYWCKIDGDYSMRLDPTLFANRIKTLPENHLVLQNDPWLPSPSLLCLS